MLRGMSLFLCTLRSTLWAREFEYHPLNGGAGHFIKIKNMPESMFLSVCPFADLFRTTFPVLGVDKSRTKRQDRHRLNSCHDL